MVGVKERIKVYFCCRCSFKKSILLKRQLIVLSLDLYFQVHTAEKRQFINKEIKIQNKLPSHTENLCQIFSREKNTKAKVEL